MNRPRLSSVSGALLAVIALAIVPTVAGAGAATGHHHSDRHMSAAQQKAAKAKKLKAAKLKASRAAAAKAAKQRKTPTATPTASPTATAPATSATSSFSLKQTYTFTDAAINSDWAIYDSAYTGKPNARYRSLVTASDGALHVATSGTKASGLCLCRGAGKPSLPYGTWEVRARANRNADHGFAMLLWPNAEDWPSGGEIDLAEFPGGDRAKLQTTVHYSATNKKSTRFLAGDYSAWHTYGVTWTSSKIVWTVDGTTVMTVTDPAQIPTRAMHLALQAGVDNGVKNPSDTSAALDVQWVKYYR